MPNLICRHLGELLWACTGMLTITAGTFFHLLITNQTPGLFVDDIVASYESGELLEQDDIILDKAADALEYAHKHYFDGINIGKLSLLEFQEAQAKQRRLRTIADSIRTHLVRRYGCDD